MIVSDGDQSRIDPIAHGHASQRFEVLKVGSAARWVLFALLLMLCGACGSSRPPSQRPESTAPPVAITLGIGSVGSESQRVVQVAVGQRIDVSVGPQWQGTASGNTRVLSPRANPSSCSPPACSSFVAATPGESSLWAATVWNPDCSDGQRTCTFTLSPSLVVNVRALSSGHSQRLTPLQVTLASGSTASTTTRRSGEGAGFVVQVGQRVSLEIGPGLLAPSVSDERVLTRGGWTLAGCRPSFCYTYVAQRLGKVVVSAPAECIVPGCTGRIYATQIWVH